MADPSPVGDVKNSVPSYYFCAKYIDTQKITIISLFDLVCLDESAGGVMNGPLKFLTARKILPLLDLLAKFKRVLACSCSPNFCVARKLTKQIFYFCLCSQKNRSARHARECSQRPFVTPYRHKRAILFTSITLFFFSYLVFDNAS